MSNYTRNQIGGDGDMNQPNESEKKIAEIRAKYSNGFYFPYVRDDIALLLEENERLKSVEHTLCLTIGEADKALQQTRELLRFEKVQSSGWEHECKNALSELQQVKAELAEKNKALSSIANAKSYTDRSWYRDTARHILSVYPPREGEGEA